MNYFLWILILFAGLNAYGGDTPSCPLAKLAEHNAVLALRNIKNNDPQSIEQLKAWAETARNKQLAGEKLSVMEHTALMYAIKKGVLEGFGAEIMLLKSWKDLTGKEAEIDSIFSEPLPKSVLSQASDREKDFHLAFFNDGTPKRQSLGLKLLVGAGIMSAMLAPQFDLPYGEFIGGIVAALVNQSIFEYSLHRFYLHPTKALRNFFISVGLGTRGEGVHMDSHHAVHDKNHYGTEENPLLEKAERLNEKEELDPSGKRIKISELDERGKKKHKLDPEVLHINHYGYLMTWRELAEGSLVPFITAASLGTALHYGWVGNSILLASAPLAAFTNNYLHRYAHNTKDWVLKNGDPFAKFLLNTSYWKFISRNHYQHHAFPNRGDFNLFYPGTDWALDTYIPLTLPSLIEMDEGGFLH